MSTESRSENTGLSFVLQWGFLTAIARIIAVILGALLAAPLTITIAGLISQPNGSYGRIIINNGFRGLLIALAIGGVQWFLLRKRLQGANGWLIALLIGETLGWIFMASLIKFSIDTFLIHPGILLAIVVAPLIGLFVALAQGNILQKNSYPKRQWLILIPIIWGLIQFLDPTESLSLLRSPYLSDSGRASVLFTGISFLLISSLFQGAVEGFVLSWVLNHKNAPS